MGAAADDFLDDVCLAEWGFMALSGSRVLRIAARIIPMALWALFCVFAYVFLFDIMGKSKQMGKTGNSIFSLSSPDQWRCHISLPPIFSSSLNA